MAMKLSFDALGNIELPTLVLSRRNGDKIGELSNLSNIIVRGDLSKPEISFAVQKYNGNEITPYWEYIKDFKLVWCKEWDLWFEMKINSNYSDSVTKSATLMVLGYAELNETKIYGMEVNTESDILRDDYIMPTVFYNEENHEASLLHRLLDKTPHYHIKHIDEHLKGIQRVFSFNDKKLTECFDEIAEELDVLFVYNSNSSDNGKPCRDISIYDLKNYCKTCGARGSFVESCLKCGSSNITEGYGTDTTIFISRDGLGEEITVEVKQDEVKNCFRLEAGDELMTATIRNCNPNGTSYMWEPGTNIDDMDEALQELLSKYNEDFSYYKDKHIQKISSSLVRDYNAIVAKYDGTSEEIKPVTMNASLVGYSPIMQHYYDTIDLEVFLQSGLLPSVILQDTTAADEAQKLTSSKLSPVAVADAKYITLANVSTAVLNAAKIAADPRYKITVKQSSLNENRWTGNFTVTNFSDERDTYDSNVISVLVNDDYQTYVKQKLRKSLYNGTKGKYGSVAQMIDMTTTNFKEQLAKYNIVALNAINTCFTECLNVLSEQGADKFGSELYYSIYMPIKSKIGYIQSEVALRESEIETVRSMQNELLSFKQDINNRLNLENYLGDYWLDFCAYRREETFSNTNYISDYLTNKQLFDRANEFLDLADYELHKVAIYTHEITSTLKNLLVMPEFKPLLNYFECGNWIRVQDDDGQIYRLRLLDYEINFDNLQTLSVTFSEASRTIDGLSPVKEILVKSSNIINNYNAAMNKTTSHFESINDSMKDVIADAGFNNEYTADTYHDTMESLVQAEKKITSEIKQTADDIKIEVSEQYYSKDDAETLISDISSSLSIASGDITAEVKARKSADDELSTRIKQTAKGISLSVNNNGTTSGITIGVTMEDGTTYQTTEDIIITGFVTFESLSGKGTTTIDGSNIKTGTIDAQRINTDTLVIGWNNVEGAQDKVTTITEDTLKTTKVEACNLKVLMANINGKLSAEQIDAGIINSSHINSNMVWTQKLAVGNNFAVDENGNLTASNATLGGTITATGGSIGDFTIGTNLDTGAHGLYGGGIAIYPDYGMSIEATDTKFWCALHAVELTADNRTSGMTASYGATRLYGTVQFERLNDATIAYLKSVLGI